MCASARAGSSSEAFVNDAVAPALSPFHACEMPLSRCVCALPGSSARLAS
jgi:hypothetical protein